MALVDVHEPGLPPVPLGRQGVRPPETFETLEHHDRRWRRTGAHLEQRHQLLTPGKRRVEAGEERDEQSDQPESDRCGGKAEKAVTGLRQSSRAEGEEGGAAHPEGLRPRAVAGHPEQQGEPGEDERQPDGCESEEGERGEERHHPVGSCEVPGPRDEAEQPASRLEGHGRDGAARRPREHHGPHGREEGPTDEGNAPGGCKQFQHGR